MFLVNEIISVIPMNTNTGYLIYIDMGVWGVHGGTWGTWEVHGRYTGGTREVHRGTWEVHGRYMGDMGGTWEVHGRYMGGT